VQRNGPGQQQPQQLVKGVQQQGPSPRMSAVLGGALRSSNIVNTM
jgi:hypothetical protein